MTLERVALALVVGLAFLWLAVLIGGLVSVFPYGLPLLFIIAIGGYIFMKVVKERLENKEDDYYDRNIKQ